MLFIFSYNFRHKTNFLLISFYASYMLVDVCYICLTYYIKSVSSQLIIVFQQILCSTFINKVAI